MHVLVDTCIWSYALRRNQSPSNKHADQLSQLIEENRVKIIGSTRQLTI